MRGGECDITNNNERKSDATSEIINNNNISDPISEITNKNKSVLTVPNNDYTSSFCSQDGVYPLTKGGCNKKFVQCINGRRFLMVCPFGTVFSSDFLTCTWPSRVPDCR